MMDRADAIEILSQTDVWDEEAQEAFDMAIAALREQSNANQRNSNASNALEWVSVKDDIPKRMKRYFIAYQFEGSDMRFYGEAMFHPEGGNGCVDRPHFSNEGVDGMYVTHWMEIPKLPPARAAERRMSMGIKCLMNGLEVNYPCSPACALFGDCVTVFEANKKRVSAPTPTASVI